ncbi:MAG: hypothetical protein AAF390_15485 [Pseudomonadota bacterium]
MLRRTFLITGLAVFSGGRPARAQDPQPIRTEDAFRSSVADRRLVATEGHTLTFGSDGSIAGRRDDVRLNGRWTWEGETLRHRLTVNGQLAEWEAKTLLIGGDLLIVRSADDPTSEEFWYIQ